MLHLHHADELEPLIDALAAVLAVPPADPFTPDVVVVPAAGIGDAAMAGLGHRLGATARGGDGITANVEFLFPGRFLARALADPGRGDAGADPWQLPQLTWWVLDELAHTTVDVPGRSATGAGWWSLARRIADLFDRYGTQRPRLVQRWAAGDDVDGTLLAGGQPAPLDPQHRWQAEFWRGLRARIGTPSPAERLPGLLDALASGQPGAQGHDALPERLALFGLGGLAPAMFEVVRALGVQREVHVLLRHPSRVAWRQAPNRLAGGLQVRTALDVASHVRHPLLASWGRPALEARALVAGSDDVREVPPHGPDVAVPRTLLGALQAGIRLDEQPAPVAGIDAADGSFQVHACHGMARQLESLRDALGHAFVADPSLQPHDVLVLCPDLDSVAPLIDAVFTRGALPIPVRIGDRSLTTDDPLIGALHAVLSLVSGRATLSEVLALLQFEPVRRRFGWTVDDVEQLSDWSTTLGTRWGLTAEQRPEWGVPGTIAHGTWQAMVDRLLAGLAMPAPSPRLGLGDVAPFDDVSAQQASLVGGIADLLARLVALHAEVPLARTTGAWVDLLHRVLDEFCAVERDDAWRRQTLHNDLDAIAEAAAAVPGAPVPLSFADVRHVLVDALRERPGRLPLRSGAVTVSSLVPQHGVPARVVCLVGLDDGSLRSGTFDGDDVLGVHPCIGERQPRFEHRQLLLDAVLAAQDRLIVTCNGADLTTNAPVPFVVPLVELLDVLRRLADLGDDDGRVVVRHPRHGFNERALIAGGLCPGVPGSFTFDPSMLAAARARRVAEASRGRPSVAGESPWALPPAPFDAVTVDELVLAVTNPSRVYIAQRLDVRLPDEREALDDHLPVKMEPLDEWRIGADLLAARRVGLPVGEWEAVARLDSALPPAALGEPSITSLLDEVAQFEAAVGAVGALLATVPETPVAFDLRCRVDGEDRDVTITGAVPGVVPRAAGWVLTDVRFNRPKPGQRMAVAVQLAALQVAHPEHELSAALVTRGTSGKRPTAFTLQLRGDDAAARVASATALLARAVALRAWALRDAVPFFDRSSEALYTGNEADLEKHLVSERRDRSISTLWPHLTPGALHHDPVLAGDPVSGDGSRAELVARWVWGAYDAAIDEAAVKPPSARSAR